MDPEELAWRKAHRETFTQAQTRSAWDRLSLDRAELDDLLDHVHERVASEGCDHSLRFARRWAGTRGKEWEPLAAALGDAGGYCDCEVVLNVDPEG